jgi:hypothetical protein
MERSEWRDTSKNIKIYCKIMLLENINNVYSVRTPPFATLHRDERFLLWLQISRFFKSNWHNLIFQSNIFYNYLDKTIIKIIIRSFCGTRPFNRFRIKCKAWEPVDCVQQSLGKVGRKRASNLTLAKETHVRS